MQRGIQRKCECPKLPFNQLYVCTFRWRTSESRGEREREEEGEQIRFWSLNSFERVTDNRREYVNWEISIPSTSFGTLLENSLSISSALAEVRQQEATETNFQKWNVEKNLRVEFNTSNKNLSWKAFPACCVINHTNVHVCQIYRSFKRTRCSMKKRQIYRNNYILWRGAAYLNLLATNRTKECDRETLICQI